MVMIQMNNQTIKQNIQEHNRLKRKLQLDKKKQRKLRTRRLIQKGALAEKYLDVKHLSVEETELAFKELYNIMNKK